MDDADFTKLRIPGALHGRVREILAITDDGCTISLDDEYAHACHQLVGRLAGRCRWPHRRRADART